MSKVLEGNELFQTRERAFHPSGLEGSSTFWAGSVVERSFPTRVVIKDQHFEEQDRTLTAVSLILPRGRLGTWYPHFSGV